MKMQLLSLLAACVALVRSENTDTSSPNIVFILWDDMGWHDLSVNGGQIPTPYIDSLFSTGVNLQRHYIHLLCGVSRSQFLTGRYAMYSGYGKMSSFGVGHVAGIPIGLPTLPQWLKAYKPQYSTYGVGKWMVGYAAHLHLPKNKGFDHFFGSYTSAISYDNAQIAANKCDDCDDSDTFDFQDDGENYNKILHVENTMYEFRDKLVEFVNVEKDTDTPFYLFLPLQSPHGPLSPVAAYHKECMAIVEGTNQEVMTHRNKYCDTIRMSDDVIGALIDNLKETNQWDNTVVVMVTDNGGDIENTGCNYPLRGSKGDLFEGNQRTVAVVSGGYIPEEQRGTTRDSLVSSLDWTPTLLKFAGIYDEIDEDDHTWDGVDHYNMIMNGDDFVRDHIVLNAGLRNLDSAVVVFRYPLEDNKLYKYIATNTKIEKVGTLRTDGWCIPEDNGNWAIKVDEASLLDDPDWVNSQPLDEKWLFALEDDISEMNNILRNNPDDVYDKDALVEYAVDIVKPYVEHPLYSEFIGGLWHYESSESMMAQESSFVKPFIEKSDYMKYITQCMETETKRANPIPQDLDTLYHEQWVPPNAVSASNKNHKEALLAGGADLLVGSKTSAIADQVTIYYAAAAVVAVLVVVAVIKVVRDAYGFKYDPIH